MAGVKVCKFALKCPEANVLVGGWSFMRVLKLHL